MGWGFSDAVIFSAVMTLRDMSKAQNKKWFKTQKFYQECYEGIVKDGSQAFDVVTRVVQKASKRYVPKGILSGSSYLALYAFAQVIEREGKVTHEQRKIINMFFENMTFPFSQSDYINAAKMGSEIGDFRKTISISKSYAGDFWVGFFRSVYKSGTQKDFQAVIDHTTSMIMRFSVLGNPKSNLAVSLCEDFIESVNYQINEVREVSIKEIDWLGVIPLPDRVKNMKIYYESLIDNSNITETLSKEDLLPMLELLILNSICDVVMMTKQPKAVKLQMINDAVALSGIHTDITPEQYVKDVANGTGLGDFYKKMFSAGPPLGSIWSVIYIMDNSANATVGAIAITNDMVSILLQIENYLEEKYHFLGEESIAADYMLHITKQLADMCE